MGKFKRFIKNVFSISGLEWRDGAKLPLDTTGILLSKQNARTASQRSEIADEQYMISVQNFAANIVQPLLPGETWKSDYPGESTDQDVGNIPAGTPYTDLFPVTFNELFDRIFFVNPPVIVLNSSNISSLTLPAGTQIEVGETFHFEATAIHIQGAIDSADGSPQVELTGEATQFTFTDDSGVQLIPAVSNGQAYIGLDIVAVPGVNSLLIQIDWALGVGSYYDEAGNEMHSFDTLRLAGATLLGESVEAVYKAFYGSGPDASLPVDSAETRALASVFVDTDGTATIAYTIPAGDTEFYFVVPTGSVPTLLHFKEANTYLTTALVSAPISVNDGAGVPQPYERWTLLIGGIGYSQNAEMIVTIT